jgi:hypothetical protein
LSIGARCSPSARKDNDFRRNYGSIVMGEAPL